MPIKKGSAVRGLNTDLGPGVVAHIFPNNHPQFPGMIVIRLPERGRLIVRTPGNTQEI